MNRGDYRAGEGDMQCLVKDCTNAAQDGWWLLNGDFHAACLEHAPAARSSDAPDGVLDTPPGWQHDAMNPENVPRPHNARARRASETFARPAMIRWIRQMLRELGGNDDDVKKILGAGYRDLDALSQHAAGWLIAELQLAWLATRPVVDDD